MSELNQIALKIISNGKGILAADESTGTMTKRFDAVNVKSSTEIFPTNSCACPGKRRAVQQRFN